MLCSPIECGQRHPTPLPLGRFLTKLGMRVSAIYSSFLPTVTPGDGLVWPDLKDDVVTAVQCSGRLTHNLFSCYKNNIDVKYQHEDCIEAFTSVIESVLLETKQTSPASSVINP